MIKKRLSKKHYKSNNKITIDIDLSGQIASKKAEHPQKGTSLVKRTPMVVNLPEC